VNAAARSFVLVHGSGQNAASWDEVARLLRARGHAVVAPELPKDEPELGLAGHAARIEAAVRDPRPVLVAHSLCGVLLPLVAARVDCALLVFLAAVLPEPGRSVRQQHAADPDMFWPAWIQAGARWFDPRESEGLAREFLFHDCAAEVLPWALRTVEPMQTRALVVEPCPLETWPAVPAASVVAARDRTLTPEWGRRQARRVLGREAHVLDAGHCPHVSRPVETAALLEELARGAGA